MINGKLKDYSGRLMSMCNEGEGMKAVIEGENFSIELVVTYDIYRDVYVYSVYDSGCIVSVLED